MSCYFVAQIRVHDQEEYQKYLDGFSEVFGQFKGRVVASDQRPEILEGDWPHTKTVLIRFPDRTEARRWYDSPGYRELMRHRHRAAEADIVLMEGRD